MKNTSIFIMLSAFIKLSATVIFTIYAIQKDTKVDTPMLVAYFLTFAAYHILYFSKRGEEG